jgi:hypothetical protein
MKEIQQHLPAEQKQKENMLELSERTVLSSQTHLARISHGQMAHPPSTAHITWPRRILIHRGASALRSFPALSELAEMFVPRVARAKENDAKKAAGRFVHWSIRCVGSHKVAPYRDWPAEVTARPMNAARVKAMGMITS